MAGINWMMSGRRRPPGGGGGTPQQFGSTMNRGASPAAPPSMPGMAPTPTPGAPPPPQMPYNPGGGAAAGSAGTLADAGAGLLDPSSAYSRRMRSEISEGIGQQTAAQQRSAALRAAQSGLGAGASPELMEMQGEIGREGLRAQGDADAQAVLGGMQLGGNMLGAALGPQTTLQGHNLSGFLTQQQLGANQSLQNQALQHQSAMQQQQLQVQAQLQQQALEQEAMLRELALMGYA